jgi:hypothetical protein
MRPTAPAEVQQVDKSVLPFPEPQRIRDRDHIRYVVKQSCLICAGDPRIRTICALVNCVPSGAKLAMNLPFRCAGPIIAGALLRRRNGLVAKVSR